MFSALSFRLFKVSTFGVRCQGTLGFNMLCSAT